jgi:hypothetical protein
MDPRRAPQRILLAHTLDEIAQGAIPALPYFATSSARKSENQHDANAGRFPAERPALQQEGMGKLESPIRAARDHCPAVDNEAVPAA